MHIGTRIARLQRCVRNLDFARAPIRRGAVAPMPRRLTLRGVLPWRSVLLVVSLDAGLLQHLSGLFRAGVAQQPAQFLQRRLASFQQLGYIAESVDRGL